MIETPPPVHSSGVACIGQTVECFGEYSTTVRKSNGGYDSGQFGDVSTVETFQAPAGRFKVISFFGKWARIVRVSDEELMFAWPAAQLTVVKD